ncbi:hypothetical protein [Bradyrhizobium sp. AUGA SZCCT0182]|uniref:hypothetical protein n=1 Tax=Bradyrhizobium sp. AUGA SZCCT0182 TaxID=2807667 RepID=UPI001BACED91|nr:hypothetical protein [Bradyrhizobium sp. AUGA SZCCT0182]MBR1235863.1 hypothetical protein [Bradyrhizobium sp. AUGA SZCCT0182]
MAILPTIMAAPITSPGRFSPFGPRAIYLSLSCLILIVFTVTIQQVGCAPLDNIFTKIGEEIQLRIVRKHLAHMLNA